MLIVDMPMPRTCAECPICQFDNECGDLYHRCGETLNLCERPYEDRNEDCPIKGVLPDEHGDLIDRDALKSDIIKSLGIKDKRYLLPAEYAIWKVIGRRQSAIAAERKDDEQED